MGAGCDACNEAGGVTTMQLIADLMGPNGSRLFPAGNPAPYPVLERLCLLALDIIRDPQGVSELELAGVWAVIWMPLAGTFSGEYICHTNPSICP